MDAEAFVVRLRGRRDYAGQIAAVRVFPARPARLAAPTRPIAAALVELLRREGIEQLYIHQARAYDLVRSGQDVVIATGTASGKSLCYLLPILQEAIENPGSRALCLFPAKALAYDQLAVLERLVAAGGLDQIARPGCYDGDTPTHRRPGIRRNATIVLSNPDMLHQGILPYHARWAGFFANLRYVVLDEIHTYRGIFGSHVAGVIRRLERICSHYGSRPVFICCSASLANPRELAEKLTGRRVELVAEDGSACGRRWFVIWNPPWEQSQLRVSRRSGNVEAQKLLACLLEEGAGTIAFAKARVVAELLYRYVRDSLEGRRPDLARKIRPYRGGYLPVERREIERALARGELLAVCSTNALELGIDIGTLDAAIVVGFPGTLCSLWQQVGRAGRRQEESLAIFVAYDDPVDQYLARKPEFLFDRPVEQAIIDPQNPHILAAQLSCAARELALRPEELKFFGALAEPVARELVREGRLRDGGDGYHYAAPGLPHHQISLRTMSNATYAIVDVTGGGAEVIGQVDSISAPELVYPGAIYLHQGESYVVRQLDLEGRLARVERIDADYYTQPLLWSECRVEKEVLSGALRGGKRFFGEVTVRWQTVGFRKFKFHTMELIGQTRLELPAQQVRTAGVWLMPPKDALQALRAAGRDVFEAAAGVRNLLAVVLPAVAMCDRYDIGGVVDSAQFGTLTIILYDRYEGGMGYARHGYEHAEELLRLAYDLVTGCECERGCPGCVGPPNLRVPIHHDPDVAYSCKIPDKAATIALLRSWLESEVGAVSEALGCAVAVESR
jgi:DEAD/DEAH box helicase domain-containing protein